jgi:hypothetical protein
LQLEVGIVELLDARINNFDVTQRCDRLIDGRGCRQDVGRDLEAIDALGVIGRGHLLIGGEAGEVERRTMQALLIHAPYRDQRCPAGVGADGGVLSCPLQPGPALGRRARKPLAGWKADGPQIEIGAELAGPSEYDGPVFWFDTDPGTHSALGSR